MVLWLIIFTIISVCVFHQCYWRRRNFPPGPMPYPFIGNILLFDMNNSDNQLYEFKKKYGDIITLWIPVPYIFVLGTEQLKEAFIKNNEKTAGRPEIKMWKLLVAGYYGLVFSHHSFWKSQRKFAMQVLRDFGVGRTILENAVVDQAAEVCSYFRSLNGKPIDLCKTFNTCIGNIIHQLAFGSTINIEDDLIYDFRNKMLKGSEIFKHPLTLLMEIWEPIKYLKFLCGKSFHEMIDDNEELLIYVKKQIKEHRETINYDSEPRDYIDAFLIEQKKQNPYLKDKNGEWSDMQLIGSCYDLFGAGMETTSTTTHVFFFYMIHYPEIQAKIHEEIDRIIGRDKIITMSDQNSLPYFNACLQEAQRIITLMPINPIHQTIDDVIIDGYTIPKGTNIVPQFDCVHKDENIFENPQKFDPTRFLDQENNFKIDDRVTPYSLGKRACLGKSLAKMELFLFWTTFLQHFEFLPEDPNNLPPFEFDYSLSKTIKHFNVQVIERKQ